MTEDPAVDHHSQPRLDALLRELRLRESWLRASTELTGALLAGETANEALQLVARRAAEVSGAPFAAVAMPGPDPEHLVFEVVANPAAAAEVVGKHVTISDSLAGGVVPDIWEAWAGEAPAALKDLEPAVLAPLAAGRHVLGVLVIARGRGEPPFEETDLRMVLAFAGHAALAIEFARAQQDRQRLAVLEDRDRIARDLHDQVIRRLFAIGLGLQGMTKLVAKPEVAGKIAGFADELDLTIREIRRTIFSLRRT